MERSGKESGSKECSQKATFKSGEGGKARRLGQSGDEEKKAKDDVVENQ